MGYKIDDIGDATDYIEELQDELEDCKNLLAKAYNALLLEGNNGKLLNEIDNFLNDE